MQSVRNKYFKFLKKPELRGIQSTIMIVFSVISFSILLILGVVMYLSFTASARQELISGTQKLIEQAGENLEDYLVSMRRVSDSIYYNVIKENDFTRENQKIQQGMNLLYAANRENLRSIAVYNEYGSLMAAEPVVLQKEDPNITRQGWYENAREEVENMHFSTPHIQNLLGNYPHQFPSRIADGIDNHFPAFPFKIFIIYAILTGCGLPAAFASNAIADLNLAGMINNLPAAALNG